MEEQDERALEELAARIERGEDDIPIPEPLVVEPPPQDEETRSLYARIRSMTVGERIKLALKGNRDARVLLLRDPTRIVQRFVLQNPRITEEEILMACKNRNTDGEILRIIGGNREWLKNYQIKLALVQNPKTPLAIALHLVPSLLERDMRLLAKSKNVPVAVSTSARRPPSGSGSGTDGRSP